MMNGSAACALDTADALALELSKHDLLPLQWLLSMTLM